MAEAKRINEDTVASTLLDEQGNLAPKAKKLLTGEQLRELLRMMLQSRAADDLAVSLQRQGRLNVHAPARGQEAAIAGSALALDPSRDWVIPQYRESAACLRHGMSHVEMWLAKLGVGPQDPNGSVNLMPVQIAIAAQIPQAVGVAWGLQKMGGGGVALVYFGDGATSEGDFHEGANLAGVVGAPLVLFCQNNGWAISTPRSLQTAADSIAARAAGYGMPGITVDGNDVFAVYAVTRDAVARARAGQGPTLIEAQTYRQGMHNTADDPGRYMVQKDLATWASRDPLLRLIKYMKGEGILTDAQLSELTESLKFELQETFNEAEKIAHQVDPLSTMFDNVYAKPPRRQQTQRQEAAKWIRHA